MKSKQRISSFFLVFVSILLLTQCKKDEEDNDLPLLNTHTTNKYNSSNSPLCEGNTDRGDLKVDQNGILWIAVGQGQISCRLILFDPFLQAWMPLGDEQLSDSINSVMSIDFDSKNNAWLGTNNGVIKTDGRSVLAYYNLRDLTPNIPPFGPWEAWVEELYVDENDQVWITLYGNLVQFDGNRWKQVLKADTLNLNQIQTINGDDQGAIWLGFFDGVGKISNGAFQEVLMIDQPDQIKVYDIECISPNDIWIGGFHGLIHYDGNQTDYADNSLIVNPNFNYKWWLTNDIESFEDYLLIGTATAGLSIKKENDYRFLRGSEFSIDTNLFQINEIEIDKMGNAWAYTRFGELIRIDYR
jgi:hypothetical protein